MDWRETVGIAAFLMVILIIALIVFNPGFYLAVFWGVGVLTGNVP
ncbi:hypothetical protein ACQKLX_17880 [Bosea sp. NPDC003192]